jgi:hypothetical protein
MSEATPRGTRKATTIMNTIAIGMSGWKKLRVYTDLNGAFSRDYFGVLPDGSEIPALNVFTRRDGTVRHFWCGEITGSRPTLAKIPEAPPIQLRFGWCWIALRKAEVGIGIRSWTTTTECTFGLATKANREGPAPNHIEWRMCSELGRRRTPATILPLRSISRNTGLPPCLPVTGL